MNDRQLFEMIREREEIAARIARLSKKADTLKGKVIAEMERRGTTALENDDFRVSYVINESVKYDEDALKEKLTPSQLKKVQRTVLDVQLLSAQVQAGKVPAETVAECATITRSKPYIRVSARRD